MNPNVLQPVLTKRFNTDAGADGNVTTGAWKEIITALGEPSSALQVFNGSGRIFRFAFADAGEEDDNEYPYTITPGGSEILLPINTSKNPRLAMKAVDADATAGYLILNFLG